jgi:N-acetylglucosamine kinase-like BadF-type ATPase
MKYVLGVDGGNTKTDYMVFNTEGDLVNHVRKGSISHEQYSESFDMTRILLKEHITEVLDGIAEPKDVSAAFGLAGLDLPSQRVKLEGIIANTGFTRFAAANDGVLGVKAGAPNGYGICSINGTATGAVGFDPKGTFRQVSGVMPFCGDEGGGGALIRGVAAVVYNELFRYGRSTVMTKRVLDLLEITDKHIYQETFIRRFWSDRKDLNSVEVVFILLDSANEGDPVAVELLETAGREMARTAAGCARDLDFSDVMLDVVFAGSVWIKPKTPLMKDSFKKEFNRLLDCEINFISLNMPPASGAVLWALEIEHGEFPQDALKDKVMNHVKQIRM